MINHSQPDRESQRDLDAAISRVLETQPAPAIPANFAARVAASLPAPTPVRPPSYVRRSAAIASGIILLVVLFALAPHAAPSFINLSFDVELLVLAQLAAIAWFLTRPEQRRG